MDELSLASNPFIVLSYVTGPAFLTNATALFLGSTSSRFGRAIDRSRHLSSMLTDNTSSRPAESTAHELRVVRKRVGLIANAMSRLYLAAAMFSLATLLSISGAVVAEFSSLGALLDVVIGGAALVGLVGFGAFVNAALLLVWESRLAVESLETEAAEAEAAMPRGAALLD
ncbi:MAG: DUF2721 domain-containing protein [Bauldia sp.]|nr:DUF2721 domain-containing protein [Bauldia sp.]